MNSGPTVGINALAFRSQQHGLAVGGDFALPTASPNNFAKTRNGGRTWDLITGAPAEYRSGATWVKGNTALAVGLSGSDFSKNGAAPGRASTRQPRHGRLREPERLLGLGRQRPRRVSDPLGLGSEATASISTSWPG